MKQKRYLIVGGAGGLGFEIATQLTKRGDEVIIADRNPPRASLHGASAIQLDLMSDDLSALDGLDVDGLIITAGIGRLDWFDTTADAEILRNFTINTVAPIRIIRKFWEKIESDKSFEVAVVSSIAGMLASPLYSLYSASKSGLVKFIEAVNAELAYKKSPNRILNVAPGRIDGTGFHGKDSERSAEQQAAISALADEIIARMASRDEVYIPQYEEVYAGVLKRYHDDPIKFATSSLEYKLKKNS